MAPISSILLSNGTVLLHDEQDHVNPVKTDILIVDNKIANIAPSISPPTDAINIDCTGKILSPGFIDTHHHLWQTQLKGRHADDLFLDYMVKGENFEDGSNWNFVYALFGVEDVFLGQLGGCMEAIDAGTTMVVDHAHMNYSAKHSSSALSATVASGIRSYFCYNPVPQPPAASLAPFSFGSNAAEWSTKQLADLAASQPFGNGRVRLGLAFDAFYLPKEFVVSLYERARGLGVKLFTSHNLTNVGFGAHSWVNLLDSYGLLQGDFLLSHMNQATPEEAAKLVAKGVHISSTPETELQVAIGSPVCFRPDLHKISSLGIDCHTNNSGDILSQMRLALQSARSTYNQQFIEQGKVPRAVNATALQAFNLGTIMGARAVGMEAEIGSIAVGKLADIVIFDARSPSMICGAEHDPVAAIVLHASVRDIETVIVDGQIRKREGKLVPVVDKNMAEEPMEWSQIAAKLLHSREKLQEILKTEDMDSARKAVIGLFHIDEQNIVDNL
ncbi:Metallo-dependent hydrolase [Mycena venus]|uniref:Metallo-dependent hydrolase n=1 Tax=Mycena venus TaxID=2733690 RepID=A0A8H6XC07_9AGAR|nr:Metallo-dependent hydrolase [Mycena venus]